MPFSWEVELVKLGRGWDGLHSIIRISIKLLGMFEGGFTILLAGSKNWGLLKLTRVPVGRYFMVFE